jgi:ParB-like chromosome segregation protein Spo0J
METAKLSYIKNKTEYVPIDSLVLHQRNPRQISKAQFEYLKTSIKNNPELFEARPIIYNRDRMILGGNMRWRAAKESGLTEVPAALMDIPPERESEIIILDNKENGDWDYDLLAEYDIDLLHKCGFDNNDLKLNIDKIKVDKLLEPEKCPNCGYPL